MELLAPAGSMPAITAAVQNGADAVYIGGSKFSARRSAKNFTNEEIKYALDYCHVRDVSIHVAANILVKDREREEFVDYIGELNDMGVDAIIIQDIGMASLIRKYFPDLPLHASTQMTAASLDAVRFLEKAGFSRIVLSRELSRQEIEYISKHSKAEIEVFVHGAICMCYSGQCLMSSIIGGRSGNRGMCAQPCRLPYELTDGKNTINRGYLLSPKDMALLDELNSLKKAGVSSLKIEGRLKRPEYVAAVTHVYSNALKSGKLSGEDWKTLSDAFNRSGFTKGYYTGKTGIDMMSINNPGNVSENKFSEEIVKSLSEERKKIDIDIYADIKIGKCAEVTFTDSDYNSVTVTGEVKAEKAENKPISKERVECQLAKLGNTPFNARNIDVLIEVGAIVPVSELNSIRRKATEKLAAMRCGKKHYRNMRTDSIPKCIERRLENKILSAKVRNQEQAEACAEYGVKRIYAFSDIAERIKAKYKNIEVVTILPPIWREKDISPVYIADGVLVSNIGQLEHFSGYPCFGESRLNIFNSESVKFYKNLQSAAISNELNLKEIGSLKAYTPLEMTIYGRLPLMVMENCPAGVNKACGKRVYLKDRKNEKFPIMCAPGCYSELYNSKPIYMADKLDALKELPVDIYRFEFTDETKSECEKILSEYENSVSDIKVNTFTRGHYFRGVE